MMNFIAGRVAEGVRDLIGALLPWLILGGMCAVGMGFLVAALWSVTAEHLGVVAAHSIIGLSLIFPAAPWAIFTAARRRSQARRRRQADTARATAEAAEIAFSLGAALGERIARPQAHQR